MAILVLLAVGCRRVEIYTVYCSTLTHSPKWTDVVLHPVPGFISKTQLRSKAASALELITIPSLGHTLGLHLAEDRYLCPVRCFKVYLARRKHFWGEVKRLFFIFYQKKTLSDISRNSGLECFSTLCTLMPTNTRLSCLVDPHMPSVQWRFLTRKIC